MTSPSLKVTPKGIMIPIKVIPKAHRTEIVGWEQEELKVRVAAAPEKGEANTELLHFLAKFLKLRKADVTLHSGDTSRHKRVCVQGITLEALTIALKTTLPFSLHDS